VVDGLAKDLFDIVTERRINDGVVGVAPGYSVVEVASSQEGPVMLRLLSDFLVKSRPLTGLIGDLRRLVSLV
jgi:hypothetical protein